MSVDSAFKAVTLFAAGSGKFSGVVRGPWDSVLKPTIQGWDGWHAVGQLDQTWWHNGTSAIKREACPAAQAGAKLTSVPPGSVIVIEGVEYRCAEGGVVELSFQYPGTFEVTVTCWPYLDGSYTIENPPPAE